MQEIELLQEKLRILAILNNKHEENQRNVEGWQREVDESSAGQGLIIAEELAARTKKEIDALRTEINDLTLKAYEQTGEKKPAEGVGVRVGTSYIYTQEDALTYCRSELPQALKLDKRTFEKFVKGTQDVKPLDFVTTEDKITPTIASDLSEYLEE